MTHLSKSLEFNNNKQSTLQMATNLIVSATCFSRMETCARLIFDPGIIAYEIVDYFLPLK